MKQSTNLKPIEQKVFSLLRLSFSRTYFLLTLQR